MTTRRFDLGAWQIAQQAKRAQSATAPDAAAPARAVRPLTARQVAARLAALRCDPLAIMVTLAKSRYLDPALRVALAHHLAAYQIEQGAAARGDKALPALGEVIAAAWRKPKAAARPGAKPKTGASAVKRKAAKPKDAQR